MNKRVDAECVASANLINELDEKQRYVYELIIKNHKYFSRQDRKYRRLVRYSRLLLIVLTIGNTAVLALKDYLSLEIAVVIAIVVSSLVTGLSAAMSYFNLEEYWFRNVRVHLEYNNLRDRFIFEAKAKTLDDEKLNEYMDNVKNYQMDNIKYWKEAVKRGSNNAKQRL